MSEIFKIILSFFHNRNEGKMCVHPVTHDAHGLALKKESGEAGFSACGGSRKRHSSIPPQCDPRGAFLLYGKEVSYTIKSPVRERSQRTGPRIPIYWQALQLHQHEHIVDRANGVFEIPIAHADDDV